MHQNLRLMTALLSMQTYSFAVSILSLFHFLALIDAIANIFALLSFTSTTPATLKIKSDMIHQPTTMPFDDSNPPPVALNPENIPEDLICSICFTLPAEPVITPCDHIFCQSCIHEALSRQSVCPIDRRPCRVDQLKPLEGVAERIWGGIQVKCGSWERGCAWTGCIDFYNRHIEDQCTVAKTPYRADREELISELKRENAEHELTILFLQRDEANYKERIKTLNSEKKSLEKSLKSRPNVPQLFNGQYNYRRENVVQLSQLISRYLECKPGPIDANKIYNCIRNCVMDFEKDYSDNPEHYYMDVRMLLATCIASTWFTQNQRRNLIQWYTDNF